MPAATPLLFPDSDIPCRIRANGWQGRESRFVNGEGLKDRGIPEEKKVKITVRLVNGRLNRRV